MELRWICNVGRYFRTKRAIIVDLFDTEEQEMTSPSTQTNVSLFEGLGSPTSNTRAVDN